MDKVKYKSSFPSEDLLNPKFYQSGFLFTKSLLVALSSAIKNNLIKKENGLRIIDIACGTKPYYPLFKDYVSEYIGIDIEDSEYADEKADAANLIFPDCSFDVAVSTQALEHIREYQASVDEIHRVLKDDGVVLFCPLMVLWKFTVLLMIIGALLNMA